MIYLIGGAPRAGKSILSQQISAHRKFILTPGISYQVADDAEPHRSYTTTGLKLFIVD